MRSESGASSLLFVMLLLSWITGCDQKMAHQPRYNPFSPSDFYPEQSSARHSVSGTIPRAEIQKTTQDGKTLYKIYCGPCHGHEGRGDGKVVVHGFKKPLSFQSEELRHAPSSRILSAIIEGYKTMSPYSWALFPEERSGVVSHVKSLQELTP